MRPIKTGVSDELCPRVAGFIETWRTRCIATFVPNSIFSRMAPIGDDQMTDAKDQRRMVILHTRPATEASVSLAVKVQNVPSDR